KILTTACVLSLLGPEATIATKVETAGKIRGHELDGNLFLVGGGDPSLNDHALADLASQVKAAGIDRVTGAVIADASAFRPVEEYPPGWSDDDLSWYYAPPISSLEIDEDQVTAAARIGVPNPGGDDASPGIQPSSDQAFPHPASYAAWRFTKALEAAGIQVLSEQPPAAARTALPERILATHQSASLTTLVRRTNKPSNNLFAELLLRQLALIAKDGPWLPSDTLGRALATEKTWLDFSTGSCRLVDGSGLSRYDLLTPRQLAKVLLRMRNDRAFVDSLPIAGVDGTLAHRLCHTAAAGKIRAKTGSMSGVSTLAGYVGDSWILVFMDNGHVGPLGPVRKIEDAICLALAKT
ncbi:MAG: D-alanyl-D-alanine carboxypeptidase/D-alanyl-D-alanine-endopeptidase, partial [Cyanobacteria bacterium REEB65]|nr:D-alanyl-D-alanine carboxypeptidase/D-alanyl-D-alanine-endopeptidase [Cyanobacteria bacterium REEB65]